MLHSQPDSCFFAWQYLDELERRLLSAAAAAPRLNPAKSAERDILIKKFGESLGVRDEWIPDIELFENKADSYSGVTVELLHGTSWEGCHVTAHLYHPVRPASDAWPLVILCCGHGAQGKQTFSYQLAAWLLAGAGCAVLVPDNIGQGERVPMGHRDVCVPFQCGSSLQGMIVMETMAWLRWAKGDARFDSGKIAATGNSGGGVITLCLGALCRDDLAALSSSGYPSTFLFVATKEKHFCNCNLLPSMVGECEMWQIYGCFAPKPLYLFQGRADEMFPADIFHRVIRNVTEVYRRTAAETQLRWDVFDGGHSWDAERVVALTDFMQESLNLPEREKARAEQFTVRPGNCLERWPAEAINANQTAAVMTGCAVEEELDLYDIYCPGWPASENPLLGRTDFKRLAGQQNAFLTRGARYFPGTDG